MDREPHLPGANRPETPSDNAILALAPAARLAAIGSLTPAAVHELNNWLFGIVAQAELLLSEPGLTDAVEERVRAIGDSGAGLKEVLRRVGSVARADLFPGPLQLDEEVRTVLALPGFAESAANAPSEPILVSGEPEATAQVVLHVLLPLLGTAPEVEVRRENGAAVLTARPTRTPRTTPLDDTGLGLAVAEALVRDLGGSLERGDDGAVRLSLPLA